MRIVVACLLAGLLALAGCGKEKKKRSAAQTDFGTRAIPGSRAPTRAVTKGDKGAESDMPERTILPADRTGRKEPAPTQSRKEPSATDNK